LLPTPPQDFTPLDAACACGNVDAVRVLGAMGADLERRGTVGWKVSRNRVCCCEDLGVMCSWRQGTDTVLVAAVLYENKGVARALLEAGADPGARQGGVRSQSRGILVFAPKLTHRNHARL